MHDAKAVPLTILMADALSRPTTNGIDDVGWIQFTEAIAQTVPEGVDDASIRHTWLQPFVQAHWQSSHCISFAAVFVAKVDPVIRILCAAQSDAPTRGTCLLLEVVFSLRQGCSIRLM